MQWEATLTHWSFWAGRSMSWRCTFELRSSKEGSVPSVLYNTAHSDRNLWFKQSNITLCAINLLLLTFSLHAFGQMLEQHRGPQTEGVREQINSAAAEGQWVNAVFAFFLFQSEECCQMYPQPWCVKPTVKWNLSGVPDLICTVFICCFFLRFDFSYLQTYKWDPLDWFVFQPCRWWHHPTPFVVPFEASRGFIFTCFIFHLSIWKLHLGLFNTKALFQKQQLETARVRTSAAWLLKHSIGWASVISPTAWQ